MLHNSNRDARDSNCIIGHVRILYNRVNAMASGSGESSRRNRSDVWQYFKKEETEGSRNVICTLCKGKFAFHGGTSNLRDHLQRSHSAVSTHDSGQPKIDSIMKAQKCSPARAKILDNMIVGLTSRFTTSANG